MVINRKLAAMAFSVGLGGVLWTSYVAAQEDHISLHGFGNQDYRQSTANSYLGADSRGTWDNNFVGLVATATINDRSSLWTQFQANSTEQARITWMFVDYQFSGALRGHIGRVKFPFGIYNEIIDAKALHLTAMEPSLYSGAADMAYDAYNGAGLDYDLGLGSAGNLSIQGFAGNIYNPPAATSSPPNPTNATPSNPIDAKIAPHNDRRIVGGKLTWETPVEGLRLLFSANQASLESTYVQPALGTMFDELRWIASVDYVGGPWDLKAEYTRHTMSGADGYPGVNSNAWYTQVGYRVGDWTPYARLDSIVTDETQTSDPSYFQRTWVMGTNYRLNKNLNLRGEMHFSHGYALPVVATETDAGAGATDWRTLVVSINYLF